MKLGLGTGSTAKWAILRTAELFRDGKLPGLLVVATSFDTELLAQSQGLPVRALQDAGIEAELDLVIDGADELTASLDCIKGGGGAHLQEKIVAEAAQVFALVADASKLVPDLGTRFPVPLEVLPLARVSVIRAVKKMGGDAVLRFGQGKAGPVVTDNGNFLLDVKFSTPIDPLEFSVKLKMISGVLEVGLFPQRASWAFLGCDDGSVQVLQKQGRA
jgi:ribose 5-phosphate isomerase A